MLLQVLLVISTVPFLHGLRLKLLAIPSKVMLAVTGLLENFETSSGIVREFCISNLEVVFHFESHCGYMGHFYFRHKNRPTKR